jgi:putative polymerase
MNRRADMDILMSRGTALPLHAAIARPPPSLGRMAANGLVIGAATFNCALCFVATRGVHIGLPIIAGTELLLVAGALLMSVALAVEVLLLPGILLILTLAGLYLMAPGLDVKIGIDLAIVAGFVLLGRLYGDPASAARLLFWLAALTLAMGFYEMFALPSFEHWFHVYDYYVGKGDLDAAHASDTGTTLAENGVRPEAQGRQLLGGLLGLHRVGSIFLEPVSAGNFAGICAAFVFATRDRSPRGLALLAMGLAIGVLADARFAILSAAAIGIFLLSPFWRSRVLVLMLLGGYSNHDVDNTVAGRLTGSGQLLDDWTIWRWLGVAAAREISMDTGFSYVIGNLGIIATAAVWIAACMVVPRQGAAGRLFAGIALYLSLSLCISASSLSIKTGAAMWFSLGALWALPSRQLGIGLTRGERLAAYQA